MSSLVSAGGHWLSRLWVFVQGNRRTVVLSVTLGLATTVVIYAYTRRRRSPSPPDPAGSRNNSVGSRQYVTDRSTSAQFRRQESMRRSRHRNSPSTCTNDGRTTGQPISNEQLLVSGYENLLEAIRQWDVVSPEAQQQLRMGAGGDAQQRAQLAELLRNARALRQEATVIMNRCGVDSLDSPVPPAFGLSPSAELPPPPTGTGSIRRGTLSVLSDDSFQSALEELVPDLGDLDITLRPPLQLDYGKLKFYHEGLTEARAGRVDCRVMRTAAVGCASDEEFLAKLYCVRKALESTLVDDQKRKTMADAGRRMIGGLLKQARKQVQPFYEAYDRMMAYLQEPNVWTSIVEELKPRRVCALSFYDIVLDFVLMDAFDDLAQPPSAVFAVTRNRYLSDSLKESTLKTIIWSVLKGKRSRLTVANGFISRFYDISEVVSPVLAWGFLGTDERLRELCYYFKEQISSFLVDIFHFDRCRYTTNEELAADIWVFCQTRAELIESRLDNELLPPEV